MGVSPPLWSFMVILKIHSHPPAHPNNISYDSMIPSTSLVFFEVFAPKHLLAYLSGKEKNHLNTTGTQTSFLNRKGSQRKETFPRIHTGPRIHRAFLPSSSSGEVPDLPKPNRVRILRMMFNVTSKRLLQRHPIHFPYTTVHGTGIGLPIKPDPPQTHHPLAVLKAVRHGSPRLVMSGHDSVKNGRALLATSSHPRLILDMVSWLD